MIVPYEKRHLYTLIYIDIFNMNIYVYEYEIDLNLLLIIFFT